MDGHTHMDAYSTLLRPRPGHWQITNMHTWYQVNPVAGTKTGQLFYAYRQRWIKNEKGAVLVYQDVSSAVFALQSIISKKPIAGYLPGEIRESPGAVFVVVTSVHLK